MLFDTSLQLAGGSACLHGIKHAPRGSPALDLPGKVVAGRRAGELDRLAVQGGVPEEVAEVLEQLQQLVRRVLKHGDDLGAHHVVHDEERGLGREAEAAVTRGRAVPSCSPGDIPDPLQISPQHRRIPQPHGNPFCYPNASAGPR